MDISEIQRHLPKIIFGALGLGAIYGLFQYKRKNDFRLWMSNLHKSTTRAVKDSVFRESELADTNEILAKLPVPQPVEPITNRQEMILRAFPRMIFLFGGMGVIFLFTGLFHTMPTTGEAWPVYLGWGLMLAVVVMYFINEKQRKYYNRVQQLNRRYLLEKAGKDPAMFKSMDEVIEYYPKMAGLWMELADQHAVAGDMKKAVETIKKARDLAPESGDLAIVEASFQLREKNQPGAEKAIEAAMELRKAPTDPRPELYFAALELQKGSEKKAREYTEKAMELDANFAKNLIPKDEALTEYQEWLKKENRADFS